MGGLSFSSVPRPGAPASLRRLLDEFLPRRLALVLLEIRQDRLAVRLARLGATLEHRRGHHAPWRIQPREHPTLAALVFVEARGEIKGDAAVEAAVLTFEEVEVPGFGHSLLARHYSLSPFAYPLPSFSLSSICDGVNPALAR